MTQSVASVATSQPGKGVLVCCCHGDKAVFSRSHAQYPLKFIPTRSHVTRLAVVYMLSYGGGIVSGDTFDIEISVEPRARLMILTQGHTKVFKGREQQRQWLANTTKQALPSLTNLTLEPSSPQPDSDDGTAVSIQAITATVAIGGTLLVLPDPVTSFRDSSFQSRQVFRLADTTSQLVLLDWFTSGRQTRGENWSFKHYSSRIDVWVNERLAIKDHMVLEDEPFMKQKGWEGETSFAARLQPYTCFATLIIVSCIGSSLEQSIQGILSKAEEDRLMPKDVKRQKHRDLLWSVSPLLNGRGALVRVAGYSTEQVRDFVKGECLGGGLLAMVGQGMFARILQ